MTDLVKLNQIIKDSGLMKTYIADKADIKYHNFARRLKGQGEFTASEIMNLCKVLNLKVSDRNAIFFKEERE